jgi:hypothetical protein
VLSAFGVPSAIPFPGYQQQTLKVWLLEMMSSFFFTLTDCFEAASTTKSLPPRIASSDVPITQRQFIVPTARSDVSFDFSSLASVTNQTNISSRRQFNCTSMSSNPTSEGVADLSEVTSRHRSLLIRLTTLTRLTPRTPKPMSTTRTKRSSTLKPGRKRSNCKNSPEYETCTARVRASLIS